MAGMIQLAQAPSPLGVFPGYVAQQQETILLKGRQFGARYDVTTSDGHALFTVEPGTASVARRKRVLDASGSNIFNIRKKSWHLGGSQYFVESASQSDDISLITVDFELFAVGTQFTATFNNIISQQQEQLCFSRGYFSSRGEITNGPGGPVIADVERRISMLKKEYEVIVAQNVDVALIAAMLICLDEKEKSHGNAPGLGGGRI